MATERGELVIGIGFRAGEAHTWQVALKEDFLRRGYGVEVTKLQNADYRPDLSASVAMLSDKIRHPENTVLVAHSASVSVGLEFAERLPDGIKLRGLVAVSGFTKEEKDFHFLSYYYGNYLLGGFLKENRDWGKIRESFNGNITVIHSNDDIWVNPEQSRWLAKNLNAVTRWKDNIGHADRLEGVRAIPEVHEAVENYFSLRKERPAKMTVLTK
ncbi:MAG: alpha/beta hydrolase [Candidatus Micrarchaeota archaeon]|nr:alpha/beta hydrolase [Candidatus Micrarchaeota archaeon]